MTILTKELMIDVQTLVDHITTIKSEPLKFHEDLTEFSNKYSDLTSDKDGPEGLKVLQTLLNIFIAILTTVSKEKDELYSVQQCSLLRTLLSFCTTFALYQMPSSLFAGLDRLLPNHDFGSVNEVTDANYSLIVNDLYYDLLKARNIGIIRQSIASNHLPILIASQLASKKDYNEIHHELSSKCSIPSSMIVRALCMLVVARPSDQEMLKSISFMLCKCLLDYQHPTSDNELGSGGIISLIDATLVEEENKSDNSVRDMAPWQRSQALATVAVYLPHLPLPQEEFYRSMCGQLIDILSIDLAKHSKSLSRSSSVAENSSERLLTYLKISLIVAEQLMKRNKKLFHHHFTKKLIWCLRHVIDDTTPFVDGSLILNQTQTILNHVFNQSQLWNECEKCLKFYVKTSDSQWDRLVQFFKSGSIESIQNINYSDSSQHSGDHSSNDQSQNENFSQAVKQLNSEFMPERAHGFIALKNLIYAGNSETLDNWKSILEYVETALKDSESYVYLSAIGTLTGLAHMEPDIILPILLREYHNRSRSLQERLFIGESLSRFSRQLALLEGSDNLSLKLQNSNPTHANLLPPVGHVLKCKTSAKHVTVLVNACLPIILCGPDSENFEPILSVSALSNLAALSNHPDHKSQLDTLLPKYIDAMRVVLSSDFQSYPFESTAEGRKQMGEVRRASLMWISELFRTLLPKHVEMISQKLPHLNSYVKEIYDSVQLREDDEDAENNKVSKADLSTKLQAQLVLEEMDRLALDYMKDISGRLDQ